MNDKNEFYNNNENSFVNDNNLDNREVQNLNENSIYDNSDNREIRSLNENSIYYNSDNREIRNSNENSVYDNSDNREIRNSNESNVYDNLDNNTRTSPYKEYINKLDKNTNYTNNSDNTFYTEIVKKKKKRKNSHFKQIIAACLIISITGGGSIGASYAVMKSLIDGRKAVIQNSKEPENVITSKGQSVGVISSGSAEDIIDAVMPSVVSINTRTQSQIQYFGGFVVPYEGKGAGSGVIFYEDDDKVGIATNYHVIDEAVSLTVTFDEKYTVPATIAGTDSSTDLAVLIVQKSELEKLGMTKVTVATFGDSNSLRVGQSVIAIGNALGEGNTATGGMISAKDKRIKVDNIELEVIQTDAAINPGNSGGALINFNGEVIGINSAKAFEEAVEGMGYAIPSEIVVPIIDKLLTDGTTPRPYIGIECRNIPEDSAQLYDLPIGALVTKVVKGGPAERAGLQPSDIIVEFNGKKIMTVDNLVEVIAAQGVGTEVEMKIIRNGDTPMTLKIVIADANNS